MKSFAVYLLWLLLLTLAACSSAPPAPAPAPVASSGPKVDSAELKALQQQWHGVPYRLGGMSKKGIDCSGFVALTYQRVLAIALPRTVDEQASLGFIVARNELRSGDLIFFKTGWVQKHVGIYVGDNQFMHASTSQGVIISSLDNEYWHKHYWQARRLIP